MLDGRSNLLVLLLIRFCAESEFFPSFSGAFMNRLATNRPRYISTHTLCPPTTSDRLDNLLRPHFDPVTLYYCDTSTRFYFGQPVAVTYWPYPFVQLSPAQPVTVRPYLCHTVAHDSVGDMYLKNAEEFNIIRLGSIPVNGCISHTAIKNCLE
jgi:hypothetical protein